MREELVFEGLKNQRATYQDVMVNVEKSHQRVRKRKGEAVHIFSIYLYISWMFFINLSIKKNLFPFQRGEGPG